MRPARTSASPTASPAQGGRSGLLGALDEAAPGRVTAKISDRLAKAHDASHFLLVPEFVATPSSMGEVAALTQACGRLGLPMTFRSGGTSLSGQALSEGVLVDTRRHFRGVTVLDGGARVRVEPGATIRAVNARLAAYGTGLGPDPASEGACTIGGVVANNSSGMACGTESNAYRTLESAVLVLPSGTILDTAASDADQQLVALEPDLHRGLLALRDRVRANPDSVRRIEAQFALKNTMGYGVNAFLDHDRAADILAHLVVGSEGTLAFVAEAVFTTVPVRRHAATGLAVFENLREATSALPELVAMGFDAIELMDATSLRVCQRDPRGTSLLTGLRIGDHAALLLEHQADDSELLADWVAMATAPLSRLPLVRAADLTTDAATRGDLWHLRKGLYASVAGNRPAGTTALLEDVAVPVQRLATACTGLVEMFQRHAYQDSVIFGHAKDGNIHFMLTEQFDRPERPDRYLAFTEELVDLVLGEGGTLKAEHGTGRMMAPYVRRQYGDELYDVMVQVKRLCDPAGILNPGVVISDDAQAHVAHLKTAPRVEEEVDRCVECGFCEPVCPSRDLTLTPRTRIVLRRELERARANGDRATATALEEDYSYAGIDTCAADGMCQTACPVLIDTGSLVTRLRTDRHSRLEQRAWTSAARHWDATSRAASLALTTARRLPAAVPERATAAARRLLGDDLVPAWSADLPRGGRARARTAQSGGEPAAVHFAACVGSMFGSHVSDGGASVAFANLCDRAGAALSVPAEIESLCCATPWKSKGLDDGYRVMRDRVLPALWGATDGGRLPVVCDAASCTEGLARMLAMSTGRPEIRVLDAVTFTAEALLPRLPQPRRVRTAVVHPTCSTTRLHTTDDLLTLARSVAEHVEVPTDWGCCGMAGDRGMLHPELTHSATSPEATEVETRTYDLYLSANRTCEIGLTRATGHPYRHILEALDGATSTTA